MRNALLSLLLFSAGAGLVSATTFNVTRTADNNGACAATACSLREAIIAANNDPSATAANPHIINIPAGHYVLTIQGVDEDAGLTGDLDILNHMTLAGAGAATTIVDGGRSDNADSTGIHERVLDLPYTSNLDGRNLTVTIRGLTVQGGGGKGASGNSGSAIRNTGDTLTISQCVLLSAYYNSPPQGAPVVIVESDLTQSFPAHLTISETSVIGPGAGGGYDIGVSAGVGTLTSIPSFKSTFKIDRSTIADVDFGVDTYLANGSITNSTITGTSVGLSTQNAVQVSHSTFLNNSSDLFATIDFGTGSSAGALQVRDTILGSRRPCSVYSTGVLQSAGYNLYASASSTCPMAANDRVVALSALILGPLASNGGLTQTYRLKPGSTAIDTGTCTDINGNVVSTDQRGVVRPQDGNGNGTFYCDVGSYETRTPETTVDALAAYNNGIKNGTLIGTGTGSQIAANEATFLGYLTTANLEVHNNTYASACAVLKTAIQTSDGNASVPDLIKNGAGSTTALSTFNGLLTAVRVGLGC